MFQRCVVVQEVYPEGLIAQDGRLQPGDQIIEINGVDMTCSTHSQVREERRKEKRGRRRNLGWKCEVAFRCGSDGP